MHHEVEAPPAGLSTTERVVNRRYVCVKTIELFGNNLTDNNVAEAGLIGVDALTFLAAPPNRNELRVSPPLPRAFGLRATYSF